MSVPLNKLRPLLDNLKGYLEEAGRDKGSFGIEPRLNMNLIGPDGWLNYMHAWEELGATHLTINTMGCGYDDSISSYQSIERIC